MPFAFNNNSKSFELFSIVFSCFFFQLLQNFLGFGQSADIDIVFDDIESRKSAEVKTEDGKKEKYLLYYDGETVSGKVSQLFQCKIRFLFLIAIPIFMFFSLSPFR